MILADKIIMLRKKAGMSQEQLAERLGVSRQSVSKWEGSQSMPDMDKAVKLADLFGLSLDSLIRDDLDVEDGVEAPQMPPPPMRTMRLFPFRSTRRMHLSTRRLVRHPAWPSASACASSPSFPCSSLWARA